MQKERYLKFYLKAFLVAFLIVYLLVSIIWSVCYNFVCEDPWELATHRNGALILGFDSDGLFLLSPFCNYADVFIFGIDFEDWRVYSDGLDSFGEWF